MKKLTLKQLLRNLNRAELASMNDDNDYATQKKHADHAWELIQQGHQILREAGFEMDEDGLTSDQADAVAAAYGVDMALLSALGDGGWC